MSLREAEDPRGAAVEAEPGESIGDPLPPGSGSRAGSFRTILRATSITGAASVATILLGLLRTKVLAVVLGPGGVGLYGIYSAIMNTAAALAGLGLNSSGVRQIAEAYGSGSPQVVSDTRAALRNATIILGLLGGTAIAAFSGPVSRAVFGHEEQAWAVAFLGGGVLCTVFSSSQTAFLNGLRKIRELAVCNVYASLWGTVATVGLVAFLGERSILPVVLSLSVITLLVNTWYSAGVPWGGATATREGQLGQFRLLAQLGVAFMVSGLASNGVLLFVRKIVLQELGLDASGHFQAAWLLSVTYVGFILSAMGTDYYPRLTGIIRHKVEAARLVNDQVEVALLIAGPILLAMFTLAPQAIRVLYSAGFEAAVSVFRWQLIGSLFKVAIYPAGFVLVAGGAGKTFLASELTWNGLYLGLVAYALPRVGLDATGAAFAGACAAAVLWVYWIARKMIGFKPRARVVGLFLLNMGLLGSVQLLLSWHEGIAVAWGSVATGVSGLASLRILIAETAPGGAAGIVTRVRCAARSWRGGGDA